MDAEKAPHWLRKEWSNMHALKLTGVSDSRLYLGTASPIRWIGTQLSVKIAAALIRSLYHGRYVDPFRHHK